MRKLCLLIAAILLCNVLAVSSCRKKPEGPYLEACGIEHEEEFGGIYIKKTIDEFNALGFEYGDSVNIRFSNGFELENIPYYNGYYVQVGGTELVAYKGYKYIKVVINFGNDIWNEAKVGTDDTAVVELAGKGTYLDIQQARDLMYVDDPTVFPSEEVFANFRSIDLGNLKKDILYRSASPCDNQHNRAPYVDKLMNRSGVNCVLDLADNDEKISGYMESDDFDSPYFASLYNRGKVIPVALSSNYHDDEFNRRLCEGITKMISSDGPYLIHCTEGKDRTGFVCLLLGALAGGSYQELKDDYMVTYYNYYSFDEVSDKTKYDTIVDSLFGPMVEVIAGTGVDYKTSDLTGYARDYLSRYGMSDSDIDTLVKKIIVS